MKSSSLLFVLFSVVNFNNVATAIHQEVDIDFEDVHVPLGFDSNDKTVEILISGVVPDTCHLRPRGIAKVDGRQITIAMKATKIVDSDTMCIQAMVPYLVTVSLGQLPEGYYSIKVNRSEGLIEETQLFVDKPGTRSIDNFTYANVTNAKVNYEKGILELKGAHPSGCMRINRIEVVPNINGNTFSVLPILQQEKSICSQVMVPFTAEVKLPVIFETGTTVFHIRKIAGTALNVRG